MQRGHENALKSVEQQAIFQLCFDDCVKFDAQSRTSMLFAQRLLKQWKMETDTKKSNYVDLQFTVATFNHCERFFSIARYALYDRRELLPPASIE